MNSFNCYISLPRRWQRDGLQAQGSVSCIIHPLPLGKVRQSYIARILRLLYFLIFLKVKQLRQNATYIPTNSCSSILNSSGDVTRQQMTLWRSPPNLDILVGSIALCTFFKVNCIQCSCLLQDLNLLIFPCSRHVVRLRLPAANRAPRGAYHPAW